MNRRSALPIVALVSLVIEACLPPPPVMVHSGRLGQHSDEELGSAVAFERFPETARAHVKEGFTAIRSQDDWDLVFTDVPKKDRPHNPSFDFDKNMMLLAYSSDHEIDKIRVRNVIGASSGLHVYVTETLRGKGCAPRKGLESGTLEIVAFPKTDRVIHVHLDVEESDACEVEQMQGELLCKVVGTGTGVPRLTAGLGQKIDCSAGAGATGVYDRYWHLAHLPKGSASKLSILPEAMHAVFQTDVIGSYEVTLEIASAEQRHGEFRATVEVPPPNDLLYVEMFWSKFDAMDDPNNFPRVELRAQEILAPGGQPTLDAKGKPIVDKKGVPVLSKEKLGKTCVVNGEKVPFCNVEKTSASTLMRLSAGSGRYKMTARYADDRFDGMPILCARTHWKNKETSEECDPVARKAGSIWSIGIASEKDGAFEAEDDGHETPDAGVPAATDAGVAPSRPDGGWSSSW